MSYINSSKVQLFMENFFTSAQTTKNIMLKFVCQQWQCFTYGKDQRILHARNIGAEVMHAPRFLVKKPYGGWMVGI